MRLDDLPPGAVIPGGGDIVINQGLPVTLLRVENTGAVPVHLTAHFHIFEANPRLRFDRRRAWGMKPDLPAGGAYRFEPGETREIALVPIGGKRIVRGFAGFVDGPLDEVDRDAALARA